MILFLLLFAVSVYANTIDKCHDIEKKYILGEYNGCSKAKEHLLSTRCNYIKAICEIGDYQYDRARIRLGVITSKKVKKLNKEIALSVTSLAEIAFLTGEYKKANALAEEANSLLSRKFFGEYPYLVSELLFVKACYDSNNVLAALRRIEMLKSLNSDGLMFKSLSTE